MEITGVQAVGARSLGSVSATVSDSTLYTGRPSGDPLESESTAAALRTVSPEAVTFPRDGKPLDRRPVQLRQVRAQTRYLNDGGGQRNGEGD